MNTVREYFQDQIQNKQITGAVYAVCVDGKPVCRAALGYADCAQTQPLAEDAIFRLASMTKPITAVAAMICRERGLLDLDVPISHYLKDFSHGGVGAMQNGTPVFEKTAREITLRDIFTHSSGLGSGDVGSYQLAQIPAPTSLAQNVAAWNGRFLDFAPGSQTKYSGVVAFEIAALIVELVSQKPFAAFLADEIFSKLGMEDTCYALCEAQIPRLAEMAAPQKDGSIKRVDLALRGFTTFAHGYTGGSAGLFSTLDDYLCFAQMLAFGGTYRGIRILSEESVREMATLCRGKWGIGMYVRGEKSDTQPLPPGSFGWSGAYGTHFFVEPQSKTVAVLLLNHATCGGSASPFSAAFERLIAAEVFQ